MFVIVACRKVKHEAGARDFINETLLGMFAPIAEISAFPLRDMPVDADRRRSI
jgi:hypothetical protein